MSRPSLSTLSFPHSKRMSLNFPPSANNPFGSMMLDRVECSLGSNRCAVGLKGWHWGINSSATYIAISYGIPIPWRSTRWITCKGKLPSVLCVDISIPQALWIEKISFRDRRITRVREWLWWNMTQFIHLNWTKWLAIDDKPLIRVLLVFDPFLRF